MENEIITLQTVPPWLWKNGEVSVFTSIKKASGQSPWQHTAWQVDIRVGLVGSDLLIFWSPHQRLKYQVVLAAINHVAMLYIMLSTWHKASHIFPWIFSLPLQCFWSDGLNSHKKKKKGGWKPSRRYLTVVLWQGVGGVWSTDLPSQERTKVLRGERLRTKYVRRRDCALAVLFFYWQQLRPPLTHLSRDPKSGEDFLLRQKWNASLLLSEIAPSSFSKEVLSISGPDSRPPDKLLPTL